MNPAEFSNFIKKIVNTIVHFILHPVTSIQNLYNKIVEVVTDFMNYVPGYASAALTYYIIILVVPATSIIAVAANLMGVSTEALQNILAEFVMPEYATMISKILTSTTFSFSSILILILSIYAVSRGVGNIYSLSKKMFPEPRIKTESILGYYIYSIRITIFILLACISFIFILALGPIAKAFNVFYGYIILRYLVLFFMAVFFFTLLFMMIPSATVKFREGIRGGLATTTGLIVLYTILNYYLAHANFSNVYGPLASIVMILFILDWGCKVFYFGLYYTHLKYMDRYNSVVQVVQIKSLNHHGYGITEIYKKPCYLRNVLPGEEVEVVIEKETRKKVLANVTEIVTPSITREDPICPQADFCEGCQLQYMKYLSQITHKRYAIIRALKKFTSFKADEDIVTPIMPANDIVGYRQYVNYPIYEYEGEIYIGVKNKRSCTFMDRCMMQDSKISEALIQIRDLFNEYHLNIYSRKTKKGLRHIIAKKIDDKVIVIIVVGEDGLPDDFVQHLQEQNVVDALFYANNTSLNPSKYHRHIHKVFGDDKFIYHYQGFNYYIEPSAYSFISREMEDNGIQLLVDMINPEDKILSVNCQTGLLEMELPNEIMAMDENQANINSALDNVKRLGLTNKTFICANINANLSLQVQKAHYDSIILRLIDKRFSSVISQSFYHSHAKNIYVLSNDPSIFVRDIFANDAKRIQTRYRLVNVYGIDIEPYTVRVLALFHFELKE